MSEQIKGMYIEKARLAAELLCTISASGLPQVTNGEREDISRAVSVLMHLQNKWREPSVTYNDDTPARRRQEIEDAFRDGWETGWDSCRRFSKTLAVQGLTYSADEFDPDWDASKTKRNLEEER